MLNNRVFNSYFLSSLLERKKSRYPEDGYLSARDKDASVESRVRRESRRVRVKRVRAKLEKLSLVSKVAWITLD